MAFRNQRTAGTLPIFFIIILKITFSTSETCEKIDTCSCKFKYGSMVNLTAVDGTSKKRGEKGTGRKFDWNPCTPFSSVTGCDSVTVCQVSVASQPAGTKDTEFSVDSAGNVVINIWS
ncbi:hypothetical protein OS493_010756 [Desmophyllum pertusum]|uniref:Uncharacterized protein n=1 Tax=Desmophyllum pertusum TaxID=174260 RepID=A0A9W9ZHD1_9CNID|nr:hypothetical protein OS493_010756 [Desmophyllum pertusum]